MIQKIILIIMLAIILCTKNGEDFICKQLNSIKQQTFKNFDIYIKDNYSTDKTLIHINKFVDQNPELNIIFLKGDNLHFANSYIQGLIDIPKEYDFYAFCDQDDIWECNHLQRSVKYLENIKNGLPSVYCSRTKLIDEFDNHIGISSYFPKNPSFQNALVQSIAGANTMVFNFNAFNTLKKINLDIKVVSHDWILYILITSQKGHFFYDQRASVQYRQHKKNLVGANLGFYNSLKRLKLMLKGKFREYNIQNVEQIKSFPDITLDNKVILNSFIESIYSMRIKRLFYLVRSGVYRQSILGNMALLVNIFFDGSTTVKKKPIVKVSS